MIEWVMDESDPGAEPCEYCGHIRGSHIGGDRECGECDCAAFEGADGPPPCPDCDEGYVCGCSGCMAGCECEEAQPCEACDGTGYVATDDDAPAAAGERG